MLLPITLGIWGFIGYKVYQYMSDGDEDLNITENVVPVSPDKISPDTFALFNNYRDPFLGDDGREMQGIKRTPSYSGGNHSNPDQRNNKPPRKNNTTVATSTVTANAGWPKIGYSGMMSNESKKQSIAFLAVDGTSYRVKAGDNVGDLKVIAFDQNGITLQKGKEKKTFGK